LAPDLNFDPSNWHWVHCLTFLQRLYKWIHYAIRVIIGVEGNLLTSPDLPKVVNYNASLPTKSAILYYHTSNEEWQRMFPVDPNIGHHFYLCHHSEGWIQQGS
ncbi:hypothetical protein L208DRAFT_1522561, partial [Tricholoma matsutake]